MPVRSKRPARCVGLLLSCATTLFAAPAARADWTVTNLNPAGSTASFGRAIFGTVQVGDSTFPPQSYAGLWNSTAASWSSLAAPGVTTSGAWDVHATNIAGQAGSTPHAMLWSTVGSPQIDLHPAGATLSIAFGTSESQQVGSTRPVATTVSHAALWQGSAASHVDLHPAGATQSRAFGVSSGQQTGFAILGGQTHATLWTGSAASMVDLHPAGAAASTANAVSNGQQGGFAVFSGTSHAGIWSGTAASWVDLHPLDASDSQIYDVFGGWQVGYATIGDTRASLWNGTAGSRIDLHALAPAEFSSTIAEGLWTDGETFRIVGWGRNTITDQNEALLWVGTIPAPSTLAAAAAGTLLATRRRR